MQSFLLHCSELAAEDIVRRLLLPIEAALLMLSRYCHLPLETCLKYSTKGTAQVDYANYISSSVLSNCTCICMLYGRSKNSMSRYSSLKFFFYDCYLHIWMQFEYVYNASMLRLSTILVLPYFFIIIFACLSCEVIEIDILPQHSSHCEAVWPAPQGFHSNGAASSL